MAIELVSQALKVSLQGHGLHNAQTLKLMLVGICDCADAETREGWPGAKYLAAVADCHLVTAKRNIPALLALGLVTVVRQGPRGVNVYRVNLPFAPDWEAYDRWASENPELTGSEMLPVTGSTQALPVETPTGSESLPVTGSADPATGSTEGPRPVALDRLTGSTQALPEPEPTTKSEPSTRARARQPGFGLPGFRTEPRTASPAPAESYRPALCRRCQVAIVCMASRGTRLCTACFRLEQAARREAWKAHAVVASPEEATP